MFVFSKDKPKTLILIKIEKHIHGNIKVHGTSRRKNGKTKPSQITIDRSYKRIWC
jgi:hypothetical protein